MKSKSTILTSMSLVVKGMILNKILGHICYPTDGENNGHRETIWL